MMLDREQIENWDKGEVLPRSRPGLKDRKIEQDMGAPDLDAQDVSPQEVSVEEMDTQVMDTRETRLDTPPRTMSPDTATKPRSQKTGLLRRLLRRLFKS